MDQKIDQDRQDLERDARAMFPHINRTFPHEMHEGIHPPYDNFRVELNPDRATHFPIDVQNCSDHHTITISGHSGVVYLVSNESNPPLYICKWEVAVRDRYFVAARFQEVPRVFSRHSFVRVHDDGRELLVYYNRHHRSDHSVIYSSNNSLTFTSFRVGSVPSATLFFLFFTTVARGGRSVLPATATSPAAGFVTSAGFGGPAGYSPGTDATFGLAVPGGHAVMVSFSRLDLANMIRLPHARGRNCLEVLEVPRGSRARRFISVIKENDDFRPAAFNASLILLGFTASERGYTGFKMEFSFYPAPEAPSQLDDGTLNCSGPGYGAFEQHVRCNLARDCAAGEDEGGHCPYSSPACNGSVALGRKCFALYWSERPVQWRDADTECGTRGGRLAVVRSAEEREGVQRLFSHSRRWYPAWIGLRKTDVEPSYTYGREWMWSDGVIAYSAVIDYIHQDVHSNKKADAYMMPQYPGAVFASLSRAKENVKVSSYVCEHATEGSSAEGKADETGKPAEIPPASADLSRDVTKLWSAYSVTECISGHVTFSFLACDTASDCGKAAERGTCRSWYRCQSNAVDERDFDGENCTEVPSKSIEALSMPRKHLLTSDITAVDLSMFVCADEETVLSYSLVCDFLPHCPDKSDETFCNHGDCEELACASGQCFSFAQRCDNVRDCLDAADELNCQTKPAIPILPTTVLRRPPPPTVIDFDGLGSLTQVPVNGSARCPATHFPCSLAGSHCLPVHVRCNGVYDCPGREDEAECARYACPGLYRCLASEVCVHADLVCDGWPQCPQRDDELFCALTCPPGCLCQGLAFVCSRRFPVAQYQNMRYLDASGSRMELDNLIPCAYLTWLRMMFCGIEYVSNPNWPNLIYLDLSHNTLSAVSMDNFLNLPNLRTLVIAGNPLVSLTGGMACPTVRILKHLDLSQTALREFDSKVLSCFSRLTKINISSCPLDKINDNGFESTPNLISVDLRGSPISTFPGDIFKRLGRLRSVFAENYKFCCEATLPETFDKRLCFAPEDEISSCDDLLKSNAFRGFLWMFATLGVLGNAGCFLIRFLSQTSPSGFSIFVTNLTVADFFMGVYLVMVGVADELYRGRYLWYETSWTSSTACTVAGFLSLLSSEMSAFIICLITVDRFIVLAFPFSGVRFKGRSLALTCVLIWAASLALASVPLFPMITTWEFYGQSGICIPLPITRGDFPGYGYAFGVMIVLNFALFVLIAAGQLSIYWSVRVNSMTNESNRKSKDFVIARRLFSVAASDFLCWFPIGLLGLLSSNGVPVSSDVSVAMAIFILPLNSTLNPFLYTFNVVMEKRRKTNEAQLIKTIESMILSQETTTDVYASEECRKPRATNSE